MPEAELETKYLSASGPTVQDCAFLGQRFDKRWGYSDRDGEMWVMTTRAADANSTSILFHHPTDTQYAGLWRSLAGVVYVADATLRCVRINPTMADEAWTSVPIDMSPYGIWGLDDTCVIAWGVRAGEPLTYPMVRFDGSAWKPMPDPGFEVYAIHGIAADRLVAVGAGGQIARFADGRWQGQASPVDQTLTSVWMKSPDEIYATGDRGALLERTDGAFQVIAQQGDGAFPLLGVAWWQDALWIAGGNLGLLRRVGRTDQLEVVKPNVLALAFDARVDLLITMHAAIVGSSDGAKWTGVGRNVLARQYAGQALRFFRNQ